MSEARKIGCTTKVGKQGKRDERSDLTVSHANLGAVITLVRQVGFGDPLRILLSLHEAAQLVADLARAIETETTRQLAAGPVDATTLAPEQFPLETDSVACEASCQAAAMPMNAPHSL
ncbi:MAG TPA: hypothetical protein VHC22_19920 [Pirellulales bacterium]|nr:hypothetical protein [Pirellulales bacterium]